MKITEEQKQQLINLNYSRVNEILNLELEKGKWYKYDDSSYQIIYKQNEYGGYGIVDGKWGDSYQCSEKWTFKPATHEEVENALIEEAKRRGFKKGCVNNNSKVWNYEYENDIMIKEPNFKYDEYSNELIDVISNSETRTIFKNGKWAEVIEKPNKQEIINQINELLDLL